MSDQFHVLLRCDSCGRESLFDLMDDSHPVFRTLRSFRDLVDLTQGQPEPRLALGSPFSCVECRQCKALAYPVGTDVPTPRDEAGIPVLFRYGEIDAVATSDHIIIRDSSGDPVLRLRIARLAADADGGAIPSRVISVDVDRSLRPSTTFVSL